MKLDESADRASLELTQQADGPREVENEVIPLVLAELSEHLDLRVHRRDHRCYADAGRRVLSYEQRPGAGAKQRYFRHVGVKDIHGYFQAESRHAKRRVMSVRVRHR